MPKIIPAFLLFTLLTISSALAHMADPPALNIPLSPAIPIMKNSVFEKTYERSLCAAEDALLFCPLSKMFYNADDQAAVETIILEAVGEGFDGMTAVGEVIRNRMKLFHHHPRTICLMYKQFSCWDDTQRAGEFLQQNESYYPLALLAWRESEQSHLTDQATDYHTLSVHPYWADVYRIAARIKHHIFYVRKPAD